MVEGEPEMAGSCWLLQRDERGCGYEYRFSQCTLRSAGLAHLQKHPDSKVGEVQNFEINVQINPKIQCESRFAVRGRV